MNVVIIGVGAMGCLFAAHLAELAAVVMIGNWAAQLATIRTRGLTLIHPDGRQTQHAIRISNDPAEVGAADLVLILVKSHQTEQAAAQAARILAPDGLVLTLQNGLGNLAKIAAAVGPARSVLGVTAQGATVLAPGTVRHAGHGPTHLAQTAETATILAQVAGLFRQAGLETHLTDDVDSLVWGKLAINAGINPLTALLHVPNGYLAQNEPARSIMCRAAEEAAAVARAQGIRLPYSSAAQRTVAVAQATAGNRSSMFQDILRGAPTEIDAICGAVVAHGRRLKVPTPVNQQLLKLVHRLETKGAEVGKPGAEVEEPATSVLQSLLTIP